MFATDRMPRSEPTIIWLPTKAHHTRVHCCFNPRLHLTVPSKYMITCVRVCAWVCTPAIMHVNMWRLQLPHLHPNGSDIINIPTRHYKLHVHLPLPIAQRRITVPQRKWSQVPTILPTSLYRCSNCCRPHFPAVKPTRAFVVLPTPEFVVSPTRAFVVSPTRAFVVSPTRAFVVSPTRAFVVSPTRAFVVSPTWAKRWPYIRSRTGRYCSSSSDSRILSTWNENKNTPHAHRQLAFYHMSHV